MIFRKKNYIIRKILVQILLLKNNLQSTKKKLLRFLIFLKFTTKFTSFKN